MIKPEETLAERLSQGPIPPEEAIRYALDIGGALQEIHNSGYAHCSVDCARIVVGERGATLLAPSAPRAAVPARRQDLRDFGALLFEMLTGVKPGPDIVPVSSRSAGWTNGPGTLYSGAMRLAQHCLAVTLESPRELQKVLVELRLLLPAAGTASPESRQSTVQPEPFLAAQSTGVGLPELVGGGIRCPKCGSPNVRFSSSRSELENLLYRFNVPVHRCHRCYYRYICLFRMKLTWGD